MRNEQVQTTRDRKAAARPQREDLFRMGLWLHDEGYCVLPRINAKNPSVPIGHYVRQRPDRGRLASWLTKPGCAGVGVVVGEVSNLAVLSLDTYSSIAILPDILGVHLSAAGMWFKTSRGLELWYSNGPRPDLPTAPTGSGPAKSGKVLRRDGVELYLEGHFRPCPPLGEARAFNGPIIPATELPTIPNNLLGWLINGSATETADRSGSAMYADSACRDPSAVAAYFWSQPRAPIPTNRCCDTLFRVACYYLTRTRNPYRVISELVRRATRIDGLTEQEAIQCCDDAMRRVRGTNSSQLSNTDPLVINLSVAAGR